MRVLSVAYPFAAVTEATPGGAEQILLKLVQKLNSLGHDCGVVAADGSQTAGRLWEGPATDGVIDEVKRECVYEQYRQTLDRAITEFKPDVIHCHGLDFNKYIDETIAAPVLATLHLPVKWYDAAAFEPKDNIFFNCVSRHQYFTCGPCEQNLGYIENGVEFCEPNLERVSKRNYVLCLGRICPEKGYHLAIDAAQMAGVDLILAGKLFGYPAHQRYYFEQICPRLKRAGVKFIESVGGSVKAELIRNAKCVCVPSLVEETSGLAAMEAMAAGTPVVAFGAGALVEIIEHGRTGYIVGDEYEMARAIMICEDIDPRACIELAKARFSLDRMAAEYVGLYENIVKRQKKQAGGQSSENAVIIADDIP